jgi:hypothetical protein
MRAGRIRASRARARAGKVRERVSVYALAKIIGVPNEISLCEEGEA